jgi:FMN phosphatase YigB (HAD superfamily)
VTAVIGAVVFDVGECLVDESREYGNWAEWLGVPRHTFSAVFGAVIANGLDYRDTFQVFQPGFDLAKARQERAEAGKPEWFGEDDLYPDVRLALGQLRADGLWVGIAGNQTVWAGGILRALDLPADIDIRPAASLGLRTALIRRGPWATIQQEDLDAERIPTIRIDSLAELPGRIAAFNAAVS